MPNKRKKILQKPKNIRRRKYASLLTIECDAQKLDSQSINIAREINDVFSILPFCKHQYIQICSKTGLLSQFAELTEKNNFDIILLVGHSIIDSYSCNPIGIKLAGDYSVKWNVLCKYLEVFKPKCLILATCKGGHFLPSKEMFDGLPTLKELFGSPVITNQSQISILKLLLPYTILANKFDINILKVGNILNYLATGGIILRHTRKEFEENKPFSNIRQFLFETLRELYKKSK